MFRSCFDHLPTIERRRIAPNKPDDARLHRGERVEPWPPALWDAVWDGWQPGLIERYSSFPAFIDKLARFIGQPAERIVIGAGIEEFIRTLTFLCCDPGDKVASTWPSCAMYDLYPRIFGAKQVRVTTPLDGAWNADAICAQLYLDTKLFFLVNPSQPVDVCLSLDELRKVARHCRTLGILLAIDEAYHGFGAPTALPLVDEFDNVLVMRTFSKAFGAASIRVGYVVGQPSVIKPIDGARPSGEIAGPSMHIASVLLDHYDDIVRPGITRVIAGRDWLRETLRADGFKVCGSWSNFVLIDLRDEETAKGVSALLRREGIFVRDNNPASFARTLMVTCGSVDLMQRFHSAFRKVVWAYLGRKKPANAGAA